MWHMWRAVTEKLVVLLDVERAGVKLSSAFGAVCQTDLDFLVWTRFFCAFDLLGPNVCCFASLSSDGREREPGALNYSTMRSRKALNWPFGVMRLECFAKCDRQLGGLLVASVSRYTPESPQTWLLPTISVIKLCVIYYLVHTRGLLLCSLYLAHSLYLQEHWSWPAGVLVLIWFVTACY